MEDKEAATTTRPVICDSVSQVSWTSRRPPATVRGEKGEKGDRGERGPAGRPGRDGSDASVSDERIARIVVEVVKQLKDELRGPPGPPGRDGIGRPGKDAVFDPNSLTDEDYNEIVRRILPKLPPIDFYGRDMSTGAYVIDPATGKKKIRKAYLGGEFDLGHASQYPYKPKS